jgi:DNA-binding PadR family transcriptional regulator
MTTKIDIPGELMPLREPTYFILLTLSNRKKHGYAILKDVESLSEGRVKLSTGTLYGALARLLTQGVIKKYPPDVKADENHADTKSDEPRARKYYELTNFGQRVLDEELSRLRALLSVADQELGKAGTMQ